VRDALLYELQENFPIEVRPYLSIAKNLGLSEDDVIRMLREEKEKGILRQTSAIFDTKKLGYSSSLVAFKVTNEHIEEAVKILNSHPGISHNYERNHDFNIWFTIAIPPYSTLGLQKSIDLLFKLTKANDYIILPTLKLFKIAVKLDISGKNSKKEIVKKRAFKAIELNDLHKKVIKYAQEDLPITPEPFAEMIKKIGVDYETFFAVLAELKASGVMRRFATILNHRKAGFSANAMVVWDIDEDIAEEMGKNMSAFSAVSHCYLRPKFPNWTYNIFSMIHGKTQEETERTIKEVEKETRYNKNKYLYSSKEFKKVRVKYFNDDIPNWEKNRL